MVMTSAIPEASEAANKARQTNVQIRAVTLGHGSKFLEGFRVDGDFGRM